MVCIKINSISFSYESINALADVNFVIKQGEFIGIIGPNGAGKSTLLGVISKVLKPKAGAVLLEDKDVQLMSQKDLAKKIGFVAQESNVPFRYSVTDLVLMGRSPYLNRFSLESSDDLAIAEESMKRTGVIHLSDRIVTEISGGERQRVLIARALTQTPRVLLLDEPTLHLDISSQIEIMDLLKDLSRNTNLTIVSVYHDFNLAARYCDRIILMNKGRVEAIGIPENILTRKNIRKTFGIDVHIGHNYLTNSVYAIPLANQKIKQSKKNWTVHLICGGGSGALLMGRLVNEGWSVTAGVLNLLDSDYDVATSLDISIVAEAPFSSISKRVHKKNLECIRQSNVIIVTDFLIGRGNVKNLEAAEVALKLGLPTLLIRSSSIKDRDFAEGDATVVVKKLIELGGIVTDGIEEAMNILESLRKTTEERVNL